MPSPDLAPTRPAPAERRRRRSADAAVALAYQLAAARSAGEIDALVVADGDGLLLASSGDGAACEEVAARLVVVGRKVREFSGTVLGPGAGWEVQMMKLELEGAELLVCAVGGTAEARRVQLARCAAAAERILAAA